MLEGQGCHRSERSSAHILCASYSRRVRALALLAPRGRRSVLG